MTADSDLEPIPARTAFNSLLAAAAVLAVLGLMLALSGCASLNAYIECPPARMQADGAGGFIVVPEGCR